MKLFVLLLLSFVPALATDRTVCASGCNETSFQSALDYTVTHCDVTSLTLTAGQTFEGNYRVPYRPCTSTVWVRSSKWYLLPPVGYRVNPTSHAGLMAQLRATTSNESSVLTLGNDGGTAAAFSAINTTTDTITLFGTVPSGFAVGTALSCGPGRSEPRTPPDYVDPDYIGFPEGLVANSKYWITFLSGNDIRLSTTKGGPTADITGTTGLILDSVGNSIPGTPGYYNGYDAPICTFWNVASNWRFTGIDIITKSGTEQHAYMVVVGGPELSVDAMVHDIWFDRIIIRGLPNENGPLAGIQYNGWNIDITDSWVDHIKRNPGYDAFGIGSVSSPGPSLIKNNYVSAASENIITGGASVPIRMPVTRMTIVGNYIRKDAYMFCQKTSTGNVCGKSGAPSGACYYGTDGTGAAYQDTSVATSTCSGGGCYRCQSNGTWLEDNSLVYRGDYNVKSLIEFKTCSHCVVEGNVAEFGPSGADGGNAYALLTSQGFQGEGPVNRTDFLTVRNNWFRNTWGGLSVSSAGHSPYAVQSQNFVDNNLLTGMQFPALTTGDTPSDTPAKPLQVWNGMQGNITARLTVRPDPSTGQSNTALVWSANRSVLTPTAGGIIKNSFLPAVSGTSVLCYQPDVPPIGATCSSTSCSGTTGVGRMGYTQAGGMDHLIMFGAAADWSSAPTGCMTNIATKASDAVVAFTGSDTTVLENNRLSASSPCSARNGSATCTASDGRDLGVSIDEIALPTSGAIAGTPPWNRTMNVNLQAGSVRASLNYVSPITTACTVKLYTSLVMVDANLSADTPSGANQLDSRASSVVSVLNRSFVFGAVSALSASTQYWYALTCGTPQPVTGTFTTRPANVGNSNTFQLYDTAAFDVVIESSASADMSSPTTSSAVAFAGSKANISYASATALLKYIRYAKRDSGGTVLNNGRGPVMAFVAP